jgi:hypothetical protein
MSTMRAPAHTLSDRRQHTTNGLVSGLRLGPFGELVVSRRQEGANCLRSADFFWPIFLQDAFSGAEETLLRLWTRFFVRFGRECVDEIDLI